MLPPSLKFFLKKNIVTQTFQIKDESNGDISEAHHITNLGKLDQFIT
jgi:hypothetical protein